MTKVRKGLLLCLKPRFSDGLWGGTSQEEYPYNSSIIRPEDPVRTGYTFKGWYTDASCTTLYKFDKKPVSDITLYGGWTVNQYTLSFESNGGSAVDSKIYDYNTQVDIPTEPDKEGYTFGGWYSDTECTTPFDFVKMPASDLKVYAKWNVNKYNLSYDTNGGSAVDSVNYEYGTAVTAPATTPIKEGYTFVGWYADKKCTTEYEFTTMPAKNVTVYAKWTDNQYELSFDSNGGAVIDSKNYSYGEETVAPAELVKEGYTFAGWYIDKELTKAYEFDTMPASDVKVYAKWTINTYTLSYDTTGGSDIAPVDYVYGSAVTASTTVPVKEGYTFAGWYSDKKCSTAYEFTTMPAKNVTVYAKWTDNQYELRFESNGGSVIDSKNYSYGEETVAPEEPVKEGYTFVGWCSDKELTKVYEFTIMPASNVKVYAKWAINTYTLTFDTTGGSDIAPLDYVYGSTVSAPVTEPIKEGYTFAGWYSDKKCSTAYEFTTMPAKNVKVYAKWTDNSYELSFESNGGSAIDSKIYSYEEETVAPIEPKKEGHTFVGWYSDKELTKAYEFTTMPANDVNVYAKWSINSYTIHFVTNGGSSVKDMTAEYASDISNISSKQIPVKAGYTFSGWYSDRKLTTLYEFTTMPANDITVYAGWTPVKSQVSFDVAGGSSVNEVTVTYGEDGELAEPVKEGASFTGWYVDEACTALYDPDKVYEGKVTLHAGWKTKEYTVKWVDFDGKVLKSEKVEYAKNGTAPADPERAGYRFTGWSSKADNIVSDMTIEAIYEKITIVLSADYEMPDDASSSVILDGNNVSVSEITLYTKKYKKAQFSAKVIGSTLPVKWSSSDASVASVSKNGIVKVKKPGIIYVTATCGGTEAVCKVIIKKADIGLALGTKGVSYKSIKGNSVKMKNGKKYKLRVVAVPKGKVTYKIGNKKVIKISTTKKNNVLQIKTLKKGSTTLTIKANGVKREIKIKIK